MATDRAGKKSSGPTAPPKVCSRCGGRQHVKVKGALWETCRCQTEKIRHSAYSRQGLAPRLWQAKWSDESRRWVRRPQYTRGKKILAEIKEGSSRTVLITGGKAMARKSLATLMCREMIRRDLSCRVHTLYSMVQLPFRDNGRQLLDDLAQSHTFWVQLEIAPPHKWNPTFLQDVLGRRYDDELPLTIITAAEAKRGVELEYPDVYPFAEATEISMEEK